ncbi:MAG TPA: hypothetical protein DET40_22920 [Lentisphaeria bacterium]|nr:MAG: hypothetical protein A2X45_15865 [Lentisphaerae bacterium GWF2_50_93]HCE46407.1 hypothetical protein [Lentisphaeria bacterium]
MKKISNILLLALLAILAVWTARHFFISLAYPYPVDYGEGVVVHWIKQSAAGMKLYPEMTENPPYFHNPYTPLFYWITSRFQSVSGNVFFAARFLNFISLLACAAAILVMVRRRTGWRGGLIAMSLFVFSPVILKYAGTAKVDMTALAFAMLSLLILDSFRSKTSSLFSGILCSFAILVKPTYLLLSLAGAITCLRRERKQFAMFAASGIIATLIAFIILFLQNGGGVITHLLDLNRLPPDWGNVFSMLARVAGKHPLLLCGLAVFIVRNPDRKDPIWWYALLIPLSLLFSLKTGAEENYYMEIIAAGAIACGISTRYFVPEAGTLLMWSTVGQMALYAPIQPAPVFTKVYGQEMTGTGYSVTPTTDDRQMSEVIMAEINSSESPVLCEDLGYLVIANREIAVEPYQFAQLAKSKRWSDAKLVEMVVEKKFGLVILGADPSNGDTTYFTGGTLRAISEKYALKRIVGRFFIFEPKP